VFDSHGIALTKCDLSVAAFPPTIFHIGEEGGERGKKGQI